MIVYGHRSHCVNLPAFLAALFVQIDALPERPPQDALGDLFVDFGEVYAAVADSLQPLRDDEDALLEPWSAVMQRLAAATCACHHRDVAAARGALDDIRPTRHGLEVAAAQRPDVTAGSAE